MNPFSPIKRLFGSSKKSEPVLLSITPPGTGERTMLGVENMLQSIAVPEPFSLEVIGDADGVRFLVRCLDASVVGRQIAIHYPQARVRQLGPDSDPMRRDDNEEALTMQLMSSGPDQVPLRPFRDDDIVHEGSDPMLAVVGAVSSLRPGERIVSRLMLRSLGPQWSAGHLAEEQHRSALRAPGLEQSKVNHGEIIRLVLLAGGAFVGIRTWQYWQDGDYVRAIALASGAALAVLTAAILWARIKGKSPKAFDPQLVREKVSRTAFDGKVQLTAFVSQKDGKRRAAELLSDVATAYQHYDNAAGAHFVRGKMRVAPEEVNLQPAGPGLFGKRSVLGREGSGEPVASAEPR